jgi:hypothetical protein
VGFGGISSVEAGGICSLAAFAFVALSLGARREVLEALLSKKIYGLNWPELV